MTHDRDDLDRDDLVARVIADAPAPEHGPQFWSELEGRLAGMTVTALRPAGPPRRRRTARLLATAATLAAAVAAVAIGVAARPDDQRVTVAPATTSPPAPATTATTATTAPPQNPPGASAAVLRFLDALGNGDRRTAANLLGPRSEAYLTATTGSVDEFLQVAAEGYGSWVGSTDRTTRVIDVRPGDVVVVVSGAVRVEGNVERRNDAFPARYAESAGAWFVEGWAFDPATGGRIEVLSEGAEVRTGLRVGLPAGGTAWLSVDGGPVQPAPVSNRTAAWTFPPLPAGDHLYVVTFINDSTFAAIAVTRSVGA